MLKFFTKYLEEKIENYTDNFLCFLRNEIVKVTFKIDPCFMIKELKIKLFQ
jgi:hypothetical protein